MGSRPYRQTGPSSKPSFGRMIATPVSSSPAMIARSTGAAPRQRGSNDGWMLSIRCSLSSGSLSNAPNAQTTTASGRTAEIRARASSALTLAGWSTSMSSSRAASATGGGGSRGRGPPGPGGGGGGAGGGGGGGGGARPGEAAGNPAPPRNRLS